MDPEQRLAAAGLSLPPAMQPTESYVPFRRAGAMLYLSGHGPRFADGSYTCGRLVTAGDLTSGYEAARHAALNMLATIKLALGDLNKVEAVLKVLGMVNAAPEFAHHPKVINGCSDVLITAFGDAGRHARSAVGMASLPHGMMVEIEAVLLVRDQQPAP
jgi:enamine deaminase RidA (YjgF/YER057c/UK114 family)